MKGDGRVLLVIAELPFSFIMTGRHETMSSIEKEFWTARMAEKAANFRSQFTLLMKPEIIISFVSVDDVAVRDAVLFSRAEEGTVYKFTSE